MNRPEELIKKIYEEQGSINDVFLTACGGSLVDLYPGYYFINAESETMHSHSQGTNRIAFAFFEKGGACHPLLSWRKYRRDCGSCKAGSRTRRGNNHHDT